MPDSIKGNTCDYIDKLHWAHLMTDPVVGYVIEAEMEKVTTLQPIGVNL